MQNSQEATLTAIVGPMYSGKSEELLRLIKRAQIVKKRILVIKSPVDTRYEDHVVTRILDPEDSEKFIVAAKHPAHTVSDAETFRRLVHEQDPHIIAIDEVQFFGEWLVEEVTNLLEEHKDKDFQVVVVGLDLDFMRRPFATVATFLALANEVVKTKAFCFECSSPASFTQKNIFSKERIEADAGTDKKVYEARCRRCHSIPRG
ncbi:MAG TPA: AAA family ATPase [Candidatus Paceibacterota bacterium]|nr:AAA family ATPase [Candidatus Paceibacterota bacterium]